jgi:uncharacterized protein YjiS (DUF1127 family)
MTRSRQALLAAAALAVLAAGAYVRARGGARLDDSNEKLVFVCSVPSRLTGHTHAPNCSGWGERAGRRVFMSYNALGLRDKDYPPKAVPGVLRVLAAGGSVITGSGLEEKDGPARALERALNARGAKAEVVDAAGEGFTTWHNAVWLKTWLNAYAPQVVIYYLPSQFILSDRAWSYRMKRVDGDVVGLQMPYLGFLALVPQGRRQFVRRLFAIYVEQWDRIRTSWSLAAISDPDEKLDDVLGPARDELKQMDRECRAAGARFYVAYADEELNADYYVLSNRPPLVVRVEQWFLVRQFRIDGARVERRLRDAGLSVLSLASDRDALLSPENRLPGDYHWNERGAALLGDAIAREYLKAAAPAP